MKRMLSMLLCLGLVSGCSQTEEEITLHVAAAASLESSMNELIESYEADHPNITIEATYDASGKLQAQIEQGADMDIFFSAATANMDALVEEDLIDESSVLPVLENELVLIKSKDNDIEINDVLDVDKASMIAIGDPETVPAGSYAKEALEDLGLYETILPKISLGTNVTEVLRWTEAGSADVGIVYASDSVTSDKVEVIDSVAVKTPVIYPVGMLNDCENKEEVQAFIDYITSDSAMDVYESYGFKGANQ